jgi:hypothetical protein
VIGVDVADDDEVERRELLELGPGDLLEARAAAAVDQRVVPVAGLEQQATP